MLIQQKSRSDLSLPWPIEIDDATGVVLSGRPDAFSLIGFQRGEVQEIILLRSQATPEEIIGLVPVFSAIEYDAPPFAVLPEIASAR